MRKKIDIDNLDTRAELTLDDAKSLKGGANGVPTGGGSNDLNYYPKASPTKKELLETKNAIEKAEFF